MPLEAVQIYSFSIAYVLFMIIFFTVGLQVI